MDDEQVYWLACIITAWITAIVVFIGAWIGFCQSYDGFLPVALGWIPAGIFAFIAWWITLFIAPLLWLGVGFLIYVAVK